MPPKLPLPRGWKRRVRSSVLHMLVLSHYPQPARFDGEHAILGRPESVNQYSPPGGTLPPPRRILRVCSEHAG